MLMAQRCIWMAAVVTQLSCGHYEFERVTRRTDDAAIPGDGGATRDALDDGGGVPVDGFAFCPWSTECQRGELTCCTSIGPICVVDATDCPSGFMSGCSIEAPFEPCVSGETCCGDTDLVPRCFVGSSAPC